MKVRIYKMNDCDWIAATSMDEAKRCLSEHVHDGSVDEEFHDNFIDDPSELDEETMNTLKLGDEEEMWNAIRDKKGDEREAALKEYRDGRPTFKQALDEMMSQGKAVPFFFASTEY